MSTDTAAAGSAGFKPASESAVANRRLETGAPSSLAPSSMPPATDSAQPSGVAPKSTLLGWYSRGYLPHLDQPGRIQAVTFRLADSLPRDVLARLEAQTKILPAERQSGERRRRIAAALDCGHGACWLARPELADVVQATLRHFDGERYRLLGWCVMPNHVHVVIEPLASHVLSAIVHSWKRHAARECNRLLRRAGEFWMREYFDRFVRDEAHLLATLDYVEQNPVAAGLAAAPELWPWSSAHARITAEGAPVLNRHPNPPTAG